ncbi:MAG: M1 family peptidase [Nocardioidaceae bacterium]|nr:M1 family peptidase [Nocardioidaceae bacterium]
MRRTSFGRPHPVEGPGWTGSAFTPRNRSRTRWLGRRATTTTALLLVVGVVGCSSAAEVVTDAPSSSPGDAETSSPAEPTGSVSPGEPVSSASPTPPADTATSQPPSPSGEEPTAGQAEVPELDVLAVAESEPAEDPYYPEMSNPEVDVLHYLLALDWDGARLNGETTVTFQATEDTSSVRLDLASALVVDQVSLDGEPIGHEQVDDGITFETGALMPGQTHTLVIPYAGVPEPTPAPSARSDMTGGLGWNVDDDGSVYTFQEPYGAFTWYPVNDHPSDKALYDAAVTAYDGDVGVFNGVLESSEGAGDAVTNTWHLDEPAASYLVTIAIGPYTEHVKTTPSGMEISYWLMPRDEHLLPSLTRDGSDSFEWAEEHIGDYPFSSLGFLIVGGSSAMETQTLVTISRGAAGRPDAVVLHELSHQWFGDSVTPRDWQGMWLNEGWAMYLQQWFETDTGRTQYGGGIDSWRLFDLASRRTSGPPGDYDPESFGDVNVYLGPALMLDRIRQRLGDATFEEIVKAWPAQHEGETVDREIFTRWLNAQTGIDFTRLIATWLDSERTPR